MAKSVKKLSNRKTFKKSGGRRHMIFKCAICNTRHFRHFCAKTEMGKILITQKYITIWTRKGAWLDRTSWYLPEHCQKNLKSTLPENQGRGFSHVISIGGGTKIKFEKSQKIKSFFFLNGEGYISIDAWPGKVRLTWGWGHFHRVQKCPGTWRNMA